MCIHAYMEEQLQLFGIHPVYSSLRTLSVKSSPPASRSAPHGGHLITSSSVGTSSRLPQEGQKSRGPTLSGICNEDFGAIVGMGRVVEGEDDDCRRLR